MAETLPGVSQYSEKKIGFFQAFYKRRETSCSSNSSGSDDMAVTKKMGGSSSKIDKLVTRFKRRRTAPKMETTQQDEVPKTDPESFSCKSSYSYKNGDKYYRLINC